MKLEILGLRKDKIKQFNTKGINSVQDLIDFIPRKYYDFSKVKTISELVDGEYQAVIGLINTLSVKNGIINIKIKDNAGRTMGVSFFHQEYLQKKFKVGDKVIVGGKVKYLAEYRNYRTMTNPIIFSKDINKNLKILPIYSQIKGMSQDFLEKTITSAINSIDKEDYLENELLGKYRLLPKYKCSLKFHIPENLKDIENAKKRLLFDDLFYFNYHLAKNHNDVGEKTDITITKFSESKKLMDSLPFELTTGQREVLRNLSRKMVSKKKIDALVQGDVGSGKTLVAILLMLVIAENGYQSCLVAPTNILAKQHFIELKERIEPFGYNIAFLSSELKAKEVKLILKDLEEGKIDMIVGTHSLMSDKVKFKNLGMSIIDEEHRFGVEQRDKLNKPQIHTVRMSATPIPRSLAMSLYGNGIDVETITTLPKGRKEIKTNIVNHDNKESVYSEILKEVKKGRQAYIVCPLINKSDNEKLEGLISVDDEFKSCKKYFEKTPFKIGIVNGKMKEEEISEEIFKFKNKEYDILISTTIIEVGVNVPNATIIAINNAERFGFAQLHQLRGRIGRGNYESFCYLITNNKDKFNIFTKTRNGFEIAKEDLKLRGCGDFLGTAQSGENKYLMLMLENEKLNEAIKGDIKEILKDEKRFNRYDMFLIENN